MRAICPLYAEQKQPPQGTDGNKIIRVLEKPRIQSSFLDHAFRIAAEFECTIEDVFFPDPPAAAGDGS